MDHDTLQIPCIKTRMNQIALLLTFIFITCPITLSQEKPDRMDQDQTAMTISLDDYQWKKRVLVLFASSGQNEHYKMQKEVLSADKEGLSERDMVLISVFDQGKAYVNGQQVSDTSAETIKQRLGESGSRFTVILIGKDGTTKLRKNHILPIDELFRTIDRMPMRQREMRDSGK